MNHELESALRELESEVEGLARSVRARAQPKATEPYQASSPPPKIIGTFPREEMGHRADETTVGPTFQQSWVAKSIRWVTHRVFKAS
jgi:hypothetical protein